MLSQVTLTVKDDKGKNSKITFHYDGTEAEITDYAREFARRADAVMDGAIVNITITLDVALPEGIKATPNQEADKEEKAVFTLKTASNHTARITIPAWDKFLTSAIVQSSERVPDYLDNDVTAFMNLIRSALAEGYNPPVDARGVPIVRLTKSRFKFRV